jgi:UDP-4-amino-4-deoxy-L-arabinose-oxoglutarate aminotransferase
MSPQVPFYRHSLDASYAERVARVLESPILTSGSVGKEVEAQLREFFDLPHALLANSWTNGAVAALLALGIGPGDEVIVPAMTFIASANVAELVGATPVFVDVDPATLLMEPRAAAAALTPATRAVMPVHLYGQMVDVEALAALLAHRPDVAILEDCAHCFEGSLRGALPGRHSTAALFSFYATKNVACGEGGALVTRDAGLAAAFEQTRLHGMSAGAADRYKTGSYRHWDMARLGTKANLPDLLAALLPPQIATIRERLGVREELCGRYERAFHGAPLRLPEPVPGALNARHLFPIHVPPAVRDASIAALNAAGVGATVNFRSVPTLSFYREKYGYGPSSFPESYEWGEGTISIPMFPGMTREEQDHVIETVLKAVVPLVERELGA